MTQKVVKKMSEEAKKRLAKIPKPRCSFCRAPKSYGNPIEACQNCHQNFCYDHIFGGQISQNKFDNKIYNVCASCKKKFGYISLD